MLHSKLDTYLAFSFIQIQCQKHYIRFIYYLIS